MEKIKEVLEKDYMIKEYLNDNALLLGSKEEDVLTLIILHCETCGLTDIRITHFYGIPVSEILNHRIETNENGVAIFEKERLVALYDANLNQNVVADFSNSQYQRLFGSQEKGKVLQRSWK